MRRFLRFLTPFLSQLQSNALDFVVDKLGCEKPEGVEAFEDVAEFISENLESYPRGFMGSFIVSLKRNRLFRVELNLVLRFQGLKLQR